MGSLKRSTESVSKSAVFIDTGYLIALLNRRDSLHSRAKELAVAWATSGRPAVTSDGVLIELANFFASSPLRTSVISTTRQLRAAEGWTIERLTPRLMELGELRYAAHADKGWSLVDCISMEIMLERGCKEAATPDRHFAQAGFVVLMAPR